LTATSSSIVCILSNVEGGNEVSFKLGFGGFGFAEIDQF